MQAYSDVLRPCVETEKAMKPAETAHADEDAPATVKAAERISESVLDRPLPENVKPAAGRAVHYAMGAASGAIYGVAAVVAPVVTLGAGIPFGIALWWIADNTAVPAAGMADPAGAVEVPLEPHHRVLLVGDDDLGPQVPVARILLIEPQVAVAPPDPLPGLRDLVDHIRMQQRGPGLPVAGLQAGDKALREFGVAAHPGNLPHRAARHLTQLLGCYTVATVRLLLLGG